MYCDFQHSIRQLQRENKLVILRSCGTINELKALVQLSSGYNIVDLSLPLTRLHIKQDMASFVQQMPLPAYLANLQYLPELLPALLKSDIDKAQLLLSCEQSWCIEKNIADDIQSIYLCDIPFQQNKLLEFVPEDNLLGTFSVEQTSLDVLQGIFHGNMYGNKERDKYFADYLTSFLRKDILDLTTVDDDTKFYRFLYRLAEMNGQVLNYAKLAEAADITAPTAKVWKKYLLGTGLVYEVQAVQKLGLKRLVRTPKIYFRDTGLVCYLLAIQDISGLLESQYFTALFENYVVNIIRESYLSVGKKPELLFYRDNNRKEINLILLRDGVLYPMMITKADCNISKTHKNFSLLSIYAADNGYEMGNGCIITFSGKNKKVYDDLWQVSAASLC